LWETCGDESEVVVGVDLFVSPILRVLRCLLPSVLKNARKANNQSS
jgi:hypothetical protein